MRLYLIIFLGIIFNFQTTYSQSLKIRLGGSIDFHLKQKESSSSYSPYQSTTEYPSVASFFDDGVGLNLDVSLRFLNQRTIKGQVFVGINYERIGFNSNSYEGKYVLGEKLLENKITPYVGYGNYIDPSDYYAFLYGFAGLTIKYYSGKGKYSGLSFNHWISGSN